MEICLNRNGANRILGRMHHHRLHSIPGNDINAFQRWLQMTYYSKLEIVQVVYTILQLVGIRPIYQLASQIKVTQFKAYQHTRTEFNV